MPRPRPRLLLVMVALSCAFTLVFSSVATAANASGIDVQLPSGFKIIGTIKRASDGTAVKNVQVSAFGSGGFSFTQTSSTGRYVLKGLGPGSYQVSVSPPDSTKLNSGYWTTANANHFTKSFADATNLTITSQDLTGKNMRLTALPKMFTIAGKITRKSNGAGVAHANVSANGAKTSGSDSTDSTGHFVIKRLFKGDYKLSVSVAGGVNLQDGCYKGSASGHFTKTCSNASTITIKTANVTGRNVALPTGLRLSGTIKDRNGHAVPSAEVQAIGRSGQASKSMTTDGTGAFTVAGLSPGTFRVVVFPPFTSPLLDGYYSNGNTNKWTLKAKNATQISLSGDKSLGTIRPMKGYTIKGTITDNTGSGEPSVSITAFGPKGFGSGFTGPNGGYTVTGLAPGSYTIQFNAFGDPMLQDGWYRASAASGFTANQGSATQVSVGPNKTGIDAKLPLGFKISGTITKAGAVPVTFTSVLAIRQTDNRSFFAGSSFDGSYALEGLPAGDYKVHVDGVPSDNLRGGWYKQGAGGNFTDNQGGATVLTIGP